MRVVHTEQPIAYIWMTEAAREMLQVPQTLGPCVSGLDGSEALTAELALVVHC